MEDVHAQVVIRGLLTELQKSWNLTAAQKSVINQLVGDKADTQIAQIVSSLQSAPQDNFERLYQLLVLGAPGSNPSGEWQIEVQRLIESLLNPPQQE